MSTAPDLTKRFWDGDRFDYRLFRKETFQITSWNGNGILSYLTRDLSGNLFAFRFENRACTRASLRVVTFAEAREFVSQGTLWNPPEKLLAFFGILPPEGYQPPGSETNPVTTGGLSGKPLEGRDNHPAPVVAANPNAENWGKVNTPRQLTTQEEALAQALGFTPDEASTLAIIAEWEGESTLHLCRSAVVASMESSAGEMKDIVINGARCKRERVWTRRCFSNLTLLAVDILHILKEDEQ
jgi:hypothetical protein